MYSTIYSVSYLMDRKTEQRCILYFLMPVGSMEEHCIGVDTSGTWATQVEVLLCFFRVPNYFCTIASNSVDHCSWNAIHPLNEFKYT